MRKTMNCIILTFFMLFVINLNIVKADPVDYSGSSSAKPGQYGKDGFWNTGAVAFKVSIVNSNGEEEDTEIFFNSNYYNTTNYFSADNSSKLYQSTNIKWVRFSNYGYVYNSLPLNWKIDGKVFELADFLEKNNYYHLTTILNMTNNSGKVFDTFSYDDYVIIEPMAEMGNYYGTAYELTNSFYDYNNCSGEEGGSNNTFCWSYTGPVFGGNDSIFHNSIYLTSDILGMSSSAKSCNSWNCYKDRSNSYKNKTYGRGIGVYEYSTIYPVIKYDLTIKKTDEATGAGMYGVTFTLSGNGVTNSCITDSAGNCTMYDVPESDTAYTLTETLKSGYSSSKTNCTGCESFSGTNFQVKVNGNKTIYIANGKTCDSEFEALTNKNDPIERIKLYQKYNYKNLLDFNNVTNPCVTSVDSCANNVQLGCLSAKSSISNFSATNLSCFKETIKVGDLTGYCGLEFSLYNRLSNLNNENRYTFENSFTFPTITAGQMFLKSNNKKIASGNIIKTCYVYDINGTGVSDYSNNSSYNSYIDNLKFSGIELDKKLSVNNWEKTTSGNLTTFKQEYSAEYYLPRAYAHKGNGSVVYKEPTELTKYKNLGYGFVSKLNDVDGTIDVPFSFDVINKNINNKSDGTLTASKYTCNYSYTREIIPGEKEKLALEFRIIDTNNPFPGKAGISREVGKNWCDNGICTAINNNLIKSVIKDRIDSSYRCQAKYEITLSPKDIQAIRKYNKETSYDNYTLTCDLNGENCKSSFLSMLENGTLDLNDNLSESLSDRLIRTEINSLKNKIENPSCQYADVPFEELEPVEITLKGSNPLVLKNKSFESQDPGYLLTGATNDVFVDIDDYEIRDEPGEYVVNYYVMDFENGELTSEQRTVIVPQKPIISLSSDSETYYDTDFYFNTSEVDYEVYVDDEYINDYKVVVCDDYDCYDYGEDIYIEYSTSLQYKVVDEYGYTDYQYFYIEIVEDDYDDYDDYDGYNCMSSDCYIEEEGYVECYYGDQGDFEEHNYKYIYDNGTSVFLLDGSEESISSPTEICEYLGYQNEPEEEYDEWEELNAYESGYEDGFNDYGYNPYNYSDVYIEFYINGYNDGVYNRENSDEEIYYDPYEGYMAGCEDGNWGDEPYCDENEYGYEYCESYYEGFRTGMWEYCY